MKYYKDCKYYFHKLNILDGITKCLIKQKPLMIFEMNFACESYKKQKKEEK